MAVVPRVLSLSRYSRTSSDNATNPFIKYSIIYVVPALERVLPLFSVGFLALSSVSLLELFFELGDFIAIYKLSLDEIERQYKIFIKEIFQRNRAAGIGNLVMSYAYYDTKVWETMLQYVTRLSNS